MNQIEYDRLLQRVEQARQIIGMERAVYMQRAYDQMESGLTLLGVTAVEDRLQEGVPETLECLQVAGIKVRRINTKNKKKKRRHSVKISRFLFYLGVGVDWRQSRNCGKYSVSLWSIQEWYRSTKNVRSNHRANLSS